LWKKVFLWLFSQTFLFAHRELKAADGFQSNRLSLSPEGRLSYWQDPVIPGPETSDDRRDLNAFPHRQDLEDNPEERSSPVAIERQSDPLLLRPRPHKLKLDSS